MLIEVQEKLSSTSDDSGMFLLFDNTQGTGSTSYSLVTLELVEGSVDRDEFVRAKTTKFITENRELFDRLAKL